MKIELEQSFDFHQFVDTKNGTVGRAIFADQAIYEMELERIFARAWNFMCHESQIPKPGDFFLSFIGEESVIATRDKKGELQVLLNSCRHRGNAVCRAESGNARSFLCTYHGWTYGLDGSLIGVPGYKDFYHEQLDKSQWGLVRAGKVASYKGFVFATMDPEAPDLEEYLGPVGRLGMDFMAARGEVVMSEGVQKNIVGCNWKLAADNIFDWYHVDISHASSIQAMFLEMGQAREGVLSVEPQNMRRHRVSIGEYGHAIGGPRMSEADMELLRTRHVEMPSFDAYEDRGWIGTPEVQALLGAEESRHYGHPHIFPNMWISTGGTQIALRLPKGPGKTEVWWFSMREKDASPELEAARRGQHIHVFGPAGMLEQDDGENWDQSTRTMGGVIAQRYPINFQMRLGMDEVKRTEKGVTYMDATVSEHGQLWTWTCWADWMSAENWAALKAKHTVVPDRF
ncbi:aromatic ring-hydroxylating oxygenase subunit alpha [Phenylobacterium immobile]|uniref:aromatic ring-hydroxylating oxygenase subunit alpha n=1 Tax=Phenylobacterium immobile TaxID=21 RepID=UPI000AABD601|nr:aromatic ring-hydroxylating dioxygenase subunit alpha [Phenylobacterium immobile]